MNENNHSMIYMYAMKAINGKRHLLRFCSTETAR